MNRKNCQSCFSGLFLGAFWTFWVCIGGDSRVYAACQIDEPYRLQIQDDYIGAVMNGYRLIRVQVDRNGPTLLAPQDQPFDFVVQFGNSFGSPRMVVRHPAVMKKGTSSVTADLYVPDALDESTQIFVDLNRNGVLEKRIPNELSHNIWPNYYREVANYPKGPSFLLLHSQMLARSANNTQEVFSGKAGIAVPNKPQKDRATMALATPPRLKPLLNVLGQADAVGLQTNFQPSGGLSAAVLNANQNFKGLAAIQSDDQLIDLYDYLHAARFDDLPDRFAGLFTYDVIVIPFPELSVLEQVALSKRKAIADWLACGGTIFVLGTPATPAALDQMADVLVVHKNNGRQREWVAIAQEDSLSDYLAANVQDTANVAQSSFQYSSFGQRMRKTLEDRPAVLSPLDATVSENSAVTTHVKFQMGRIVATTTPPDLLDEKAWMRLLTHAYANDRKLGIAPHLGQEPVNFSEIEMFEVPGVGDPPRLAFLVFILIYALVMGPGLYWMLSRKKQLALLTVWVPVVSIVATLGLLSFTLIKDGFSMRSVVFSASVIDNRSGHVLTQTDTAVFAGWSVNPYRFENDELPLPSIWSFDQSRILLSQEDDHWMLRGGQMRSRVKHQVNTVKAATSDLRLEIYPDPGTNNQTQWIIENRMGVQVAAVRFKTPDGTFYAYDLAPDEKRVGENQPGKGSSIEDIRSALPSENLNSYRNYQRNMRPSRPYSEDNQDGIVFQSLGIRTLESIKSLGAWSWLPKTWDEPGTYVALLDESPFAKQLVPTTKPQQQKHVIYGRW